MTQIGNKKYSTLLLKVIVVVTVVAGRRDSGDRDGDGLTIVAIVAIDKTFSGYLD